MALVTVTLKGQVLLYSNASWSGDKLKSDDHAAFSPNRAMRPSTRNASLIFVAASKFSYRSGASLTKANNNMAAEKSGQTGDEVEP